MSRHFLISLTLTVLVSSIAQAQQVEASRPDNTPRTVAAITLPAPILPSPSPPQFEPPTVRPAPLTYITPAAGVLSSGYGMRWGRMHSGIDIAEPIGTPVMAAAAGTVEFAGSTTGGYGNLIDVRHSDGSMTRYAHLDRVHVQKGDCVTQGQVIGEMGSTGLSTGSHLHFEIRLAVKGAVNPVAYLSGSQTARREP